jgi:hypothetical protein
LQRSLFVPNVVVPPKHALHRGFALTKPSWEINPARHSLQEGLVMPGFSSRPAGQAAQQQQQQQVQCEQCAGLWPEEHAERAAQVHTVATCYHISALYRSTILLTQLLLVQMPCECFKTSAGHSMKAQLQHLHAVDSATAQAAYAEK